MISKSKSRRAVSFVLVTAASVACFSVINIRADTTEPAPAVTGQTKDLDFGKLFDAAVSSVESNFYNTDKLKRTDWSARAKQLRKLVAASKSRDEAVRRINDLLAELKTSHTALYTPDDYQYYILLDIVGLSGDKSQFISRNFWGDTIYFPGIGIFTKKVDGKHFIDGVLEDSPASRAGLQFGDEVLTVDGAPYAPIAAFRGKIGQTAAITVRTKADAKPITHNILVVPIRPGASFVAATAASARITQAKGKRIGYVHVWSSHDITGLQAALDRLAPGKSRRDESPLTYAPIDALIVDMRGRVGGTVTVANSYLKLLDEVPSYWGNLKIIRRGGSNTHGGRDQDTPSYRGRSAMLTDSYTRSAGEMVAYGFKKSGFGTVIGTRTAGAVSSGMTVLMPGDLLLYVASAGLEFDGQSLEGTGVSPDVIADRPLPYAEGHDPVVNKAVELLANQLSAHETRTQ